MRYCFDIDGTICSTDESHNYELAKPFQDVIEKINELYKNNYIVLFTARGGSSKIDWHDLTVHQLKKWGVNYHELIDKNKPSYDIFIDDKAINSVDWRKSLTKKVGFVAGNFDVIHPGYIQMFKESKEHCTHLIVGLHSDPSIERPNKIKPILTYEERYEILSSIKYIDDVRRYDTENDLLNLLKEIKPHIRFLGDDYKNKSFTGDNLNIEIYYLSRNHGWSSTKFKHKMYDQMNQTTYNRL